MAVEFATLPRTVSSVGARATRSCTYDLGPDRPGDVLSAPARARDPSAWASGRTATVPTVRAGRLQPDRTDHTAAGTTNRPDQPRPDLSLGQDDRRQQQVDHRDEPRAARDRQISGVLAKLGDVERVRAAGDRTAACPSPRSRRTPRRPSPALLGPVHVLEVEDQRELVEDQRGADPEERREDGPGRLASRPRRRAIRHHRRSPWSPRRTRRDARGVRRA